MPQVRRLWIGILTVIVIFCVDVLLLYVGVVNTAQFWGIVGLGVVFLASSFVDDAYSARRVKRNSNRNET
jgi:hypothetical protein